jgi:hypothetical protein
MVQVPVGYTTWKDAIEDFVQARLENETPCSNAGIKVWNTFAYIALEIMPEICA